MHKAKTPPSGTAQENVTAASLRGRPTSVKQARNGTVAEYLPQVDEATGPEVSGNADAPKRKRTIAKTFIPAALDDAGLTAHEFRVFCRVSRRGRCHESIPDIAQGCRMDRETVGAALKHLVKLKLLLKETRPGTTNVYRVNPAEKPATHPAEKPATKVPPAKVPQGKEEGKGLGGGQDFVSFCRAYGREDGHGHALVEGFIAHHERTGQKIRGQPIRNIRAALSAWCAKAERAREQGTYTCDFIRELSDRLELDEEVTEKFIEQYERSDGLVPNPATGQDEPVRDIHAVLVAFHDKVESDMNGTW